MSDEFFGFNTTQAETLQRLLGTGNAGAEIAKLNAWATTLATKLNNDAGVTDTNYSTTPQA